MKDYPKIVISLLGFLAALISISLGASHLVTESLPLRIVAVIGYIIFAGGVRWFAFTTEAAMKWREISIVLLFVVTIPFSIWVGTWITAPSSPSSTSPVVGNLVKQWDMETSAEGWEDIIRLDAGWGNPQTTKRAAIPASDGERGVGYDLRLDAGGWLNYVIQYLDPVQADVVVAHFYLPNAQDVEANWVGIQATDRKSGLLLDRSAASISFGEWTQVVLDLRAKYDLSDVRLNDRAVNIEVFYAVKGKTKLNTDTIRARLDDVALYKDVGYEVGARLEQRGAGHLLFDFEDERLGWQIVSGRTQTDTIKLSTEQAHRGSTSLKLEARLASGDNSFVKTVWRGFVPQGGWIARIYVPDNVPTGTSVWANLFTYSKSGGQDSAPVLLTKGMWNTLMWDTHKVDWGTTKDITIGIQIGAEGGPYQGSIYIDDVQAFER
jgi:hypothetical protein